MVAMLQWKIIIAENRILKMIEMIKTIMFRLFFVLIITGCSPALKQPTTTTTQDSSNNNKNISYSEIVNRLTDLKALATLPVAGEKSSMWASYDRKSKVDSTSGAFIGWGANND